MKRQMNEENFFFSIEQIGPKVADAMCSMSKFDIRFYGWC